MDSEEEDWISQMLDEMVVESSEEKDDTVSSWETPMLEQQQSIHAHEDYRHHNVITPDDIARAAVIDPQSTNDTSKIPPTRRYNEVDVDLEYSTDSNNLFRDAWHTPPETPERPGEHHTNPPMGFPTRHNTGYAQSNRSEEDHQLWYIVEQCLQLESPGWKRFQQDELQGSVDNLVRMVVKPDTVWQRRTHHVRTQGHHIDTELEEKGDLLSFNSQELYTLQQLGTYIGPSTLTEAREKLANLTPQRWIQWRRFESGVRIAKHQGRQRYHRDQSQSNRTPYNRGSFGRGNPPAGRGRGGRYAHAQGNNQMYPTSSTRGRPYRPPHIRQSESYLGDPSYQRSGHNSRQYHDGRHDSHGDTWHDRHPRDTQSYLPKRPPHSRVSSMHDDTSARPSCPPNGFTDVHAHNEWHQQEPQAHNHSKQSSSAHPSPSIPPNRVECTEPTAMDNPPPRPTLVQVRESIQRTQRYLSLPAALNQISPQLEFFITHVVQDVHRRGLCATIPPTHTTRGAPSCGPSCDTRPADGRTTSGTHSAAWDASPERHYMHRGQPHTLNTAYGQRPSGPTPPRSASSTSDQAHQAYFYSNGPKRQTKLTPDKFTAKFNGTADDFEQFMRGTRLCLGAYNLSYLINPRLVRAWSLHSNKEHPEIAGAIPEPLRYRDQFLMDNTALYHLLGSKLNLPATAHLTEVQSPASDQLHADGIALWASLMDMFWSPKDIHIRLSRCFDSLARPMGLRETMDLYVSRMHGEYLKLLNIKESFDGSGDDYFKTWLLIQMKNPQYVEIRERLFDDPENLDDTMRMLRSSARRRTFDARIQNHRRWEGSAPFPRRIQTSVTQSDGQECTTPSSESLATVHGYLSKISDEAWRQLPRDVRDAVIRLRRETQMNPDTGSTPPNCHGTPPTASPGRSNHDRQYGGTVRSHLMCQGQTPDHEASSADSCDHMQQHYGDPAGKAHLGDYSDQ